MSKKLKVGVIGCGNMGTAIIKGIRSNHNLLLCEEDKKRCRYLYNTFKLKVRNIEETVNSSDVIILSVKPQSFNKVLDEMKKYVTSDKLIISIAAGITSRFIEKSLSMKIKVIRTMPNLPAQVGSGITAVSKGRFSTKADVKTACNIFNSIGETIVVDEKMIDTITAVSGSGPAYVFLFIESFSKAAVSLGLSRTESMKLVMQTIKGAVNLLDDSNQSPEDLRKKVTSKGGTTQAAMDVFMKNKIDRIFKDALKAAKKRAKELSK